MYVCSAFQIDMQRVLLMLTPFSSVGCTMAPLSNLLIRMQIASSAPKSGGTLTLAEPVLNKVNCQPRPDSFLRLLATAWALAVLIVQQTFMRSNLL